MKDLSCDKVSMEMKIAERMETKDKRVYLLRVLIPPITDLVCNPSTAFL